MAGRFGLKQAFRNGGGETENDDRKAVVEADNIDPLALAAAVPAETAVLLTCSDVDSQARCEALQPLVAALSDTALTVVELVGVSHVLRDDPTDSIANYAIPPGNDFGPIGSASFSTSPWANLDD